MTKIQLPKIELTPEQESFVENTFLLLLLEGEDEKGIPIYAYLGIKAVDWEKLREKISGNQKIILNDWGKVFAHGQGKVPSEEHKDYMEATYFFNHNKINAGILN